MKLDQLFLGSVQIYKTEDFTKEFVFANKRIPLLLCDVTKENFDAVIRKIVSLYGAEKQVYIFADADDNPEASLTVSQIKADDYGYILLESENLVEHKAFDYSDLSEIMKRLRGDGGCEWDRAQNHQSIRINLIEECYELLEALDENDKNMMIEEIGDVLLQAVFHTQISFEEGMFSEGEMFTALCRKLLDRHTHIFGKNHANNADEALVFWTEAKKKEKGYTSATDAMDRVPKNLPALLYSEKIQKIAKKSGFDWDNVNGAAEKVGEELGELLAATVDTRAEEAGDLLFAVCNVLRFFKVDPEIALHDANRKFASRFAAVEKMATENGKLMTDYTLEELDVFWNKAKAAEKNEK